MKSKIGEAGSAQREGHAAPGLERFGSAIDELGGSARAVKTRAVGNYVEAKNGREWTGNRLVQ